MICTFPSRTRKRRWVYECGGANIPACCHCRRHPNKTPRCHPLSRRGEEESAKIRFHSLSPAAAYLLATFVRARRESDRRIIQCVKFSFPFCIFVTPHHYLPSRGFCLSFVSNPFIFYTEHRHRRCVVINAPALSTLSSNPLFPLFVCVGAHWRFQSSSCWKLQK